MLSIEGQNESEKKNIDEIRIVRKINPQSRSVEPVSFNNPNDVFCK